MPEKAQTLCDYVFVDAPYTEDDSRRVPQINSLYWSRNDIDTGKWILAPNMRLMMKLMAIDTGLDSKRDIYVSYNPTNKTDETTRNWTLVCEHGEVGSCISARVAKNRTDGVCTCKNADGLNVRANGPLSVKSIEKVLGDNPPPADSVYGMLQHWNTKEITVRGRLMRHVPHTNGISTTYLMKKSGSFCCPHGNTMRVIRESKKCEQTGITKKRRNTCTCNFKQPYIRSGQIPMICKPAVVSSTTVKPMSDNACATE